MRGISKERLIIIGLFYVMAFFIILIQVFNLQVIQGEKYEEQSQRRLLRESTILAPRGSILDRNNIPIAENRMGYSVTMVRNIKENQKLNEMLMRLIRVFEKNNDVYQTSLNKYITFNPIDYGPMIKNNAVAIENWKKEVINNKKDLELLKTPKDIYNYLKFQKYKINQINNEEDVYKLMSIRYEMQITGVTSINPIYFARDVKKETVAEIEERHFDFQGVSTEIAPVRRYVEAYNEAHLLGYVSKLDAEEYKIKKDFGYGINDLIGKTGIEYLAEKYLRGIDGRRQVEVDTSGRLTDEIEGKPAISGNDVVLTIDRKLQKTAMESLEKNLQIIRSQADGKRNFGDASAGAVLAMDVNTGEVLVAASYPSYDPTIFLPSPQDKKAQAKKIEVLTDKTSPMLNRTISGTYAPGSTFKPLTAIAALEEKVILPNTKVLDTGKTEIGGWPFFCLEFRMGLGAHGNISLKEALATSCNIYFHEIGYRTTIDKISKWAKIFGLGELTGIDLPGESKGIRAEKETKRKYLKEPWYPADTAQAAIGQMNNAFTPLQLVRYTAAIGNGGKLLTPHIIKKVVKHDGTIVQEAKPEFNKIELQQETIAAIKEGMVAVTNANDGTAVQVFKDFPFQVAGKTGTPETGLESRGISSNGLFISYAPAESPRIAIVVVLERGVWGANAAPIARDIMKEYFGVNQRKFNELVAGSKIHAEVLP